MERIQVSNSGPLARPPLSVRFSSLVVASEPSIRRIIVGQLARAGYCVAEADDSSTGLQRARATQPDIVIIDCNLPTRHGIDLCRDLRNLEGGGEPFVILILGPEDDSRLFEAFEAGMDDYVTRPLHPWALISRVAAGERILRLTTRRTKSACGFSPSN